MQIVLRIFLAIGISASALPSDCQYTKNAIASPITACHGQQGMTAVLCTSTSEESGKHVQQKAEEYQQEKQWNDIAASAREQAPADITVDEEFSSMMDQRIALFEYASRVLESKDEEKPKHLFAYFKALPRDFKTFFQITHSTYHGDGIALICIDDLWCTCDYSNPWGTFYPDEEAEVNPNLFNISSSWKEVLEARLAQKKFLVRSYNESSFLPIELGGRSYVFKGLKEVIPEEVYYRKMISMSIGAFWDKSAETVDLQWELWKLLHENLSLFVKILDEYSEDDIAGVFYFMYDGIHPEDKYIKLSSCPYKALAELSCKVAHNYERACYQFDLWEPSPSCELHND